MHALIDSNYQGYFTFEAYCSFGCEKITDRNKRQFPADTRLYRPTRELKIELEKFLYQVGKHILTSYNCFEE